MDDDNEPSREDEGQPKEERSSTDSSGSSESSSLRNIVTTGIKHPGANDVMFGRGGDTNYHIGNHRFRTMADEYVQSYREASRKEKAVIVQQLVDSWRDQTPAGRFLTRTDPSKGEDSLWHDVGTELALKKASKILTEIASTTAKSSKKRQARSEGTGSAPDDRAPRQRQQQPQLKQPPPQQPQPRGQQQQSYPGVAAYQALPQASLPQNQFQLSQFPSPPAQSVFQGTTSAPQVPGQPVRLDPSLSRLPGLFASGTPRQGGIPVPMHQQPLPMPQQQQPSILPQQAQMPQQQQMILQQQQQQSVPHVRFPTDLGNPALGLLHTATPQQQRTGMLPTGGDAGTGSRGNEAILPPPPPRRQGNLKEDDSPPVEGKSEQKGNDESPPVDEGAAEQMPSAASLSGVFTSSSSSGNQQGDSSSSSEKPSGDSPSPESKK